MSDEQLQAAPPHAPPPLVRDGEDVAIRDEDGSVSMIHRSDLVAAIGEGARPATEREYNEAKLGKAGEVASGAIGVGQGLSFGYALPAAVDTADALGATDTAEQIRRGYKLAKETSPNAMLGGEVAGALLPMAFGVPPAEAEAALAEGVGARALQRGIAAAPRAAAEGAAIGIGGQATEDAIDNKDFAASSYLTAGFKGGALGLLLGTGTAAGLGAAADRVASARLFGRGVDAADEGVVRAASDEAAVAAEPRSLAKISIDPDAGLYGREPAVEKPFLFGKGRNSVSLDTNALESEFASGVRGVEPIGPRGTAERIRASADGAPDRWVGSGDDSFLLHAHEVPFDSSPFLKAGKVPRIRGDEDALFGEATAPVFNKSLGFDKSFVPEAERAPINLTHGFEPSFRAPNDGGALSTDEPLQDAFRISRKKDGSRLVGLGDVEQDGLIGTQRGIAIQKDPAAIAEQAAEMRAAGASPKSVSTWLDEQASKFAFKSTGAKASDVRRLAGDVESQQEEMRRIGERLRTETVNGKPLVEATAPQSEIAKRITERANEVGKDLGKMRGELDRAVARPDINEIAQRFQQEVAIPASRMPLGEADVEAAQRYLDDMIEKGGTRPSFEKLYSYRRRLDDKLAKEYQRFPNAPAAPGADAMHALRGIIEDEYTRAGERAAKELGGEFANRYKLQKELYADLATARKIARGEAERNSGANFISLTDAVAGFSTGGLSGVAAVAANQVRRKFGDQIAAHVLGQAAKLTAVQKAATEVDASLNKGAKAFVAGTADKVRPPRKITADEVRAIRDAVRTPDIVQARVNAGLGDMATYAPKTAAAATTRAMLIASFLRDTLPKEPAPTTLSFGRKQRPLSDTELQTAGQAIETIEDPRVVLDRLREGRLTRAHVTALKVGHPEVYTKLVNYITDHGAELREELPVQQQVAISMLFGQPVTEAMLPKNVKAFQSTFVDGSPAPQGSGGTMGGGAPVHGLKSPGGSRATEFDNLEVGK